MTFPSNNLIDVWAAQITLAHINGSLPHGAELPEAMPFRGDIFILEEKDGTDILYSWWGKWERGPTLKRPQR